MSTDDNSSNNTNTVASEVLLELPTAAPTLTNVKYHVSLELTYTNYLNWKKMISKFLDCQDVLGVVDGTIPCPDPTHSQYKLWNRCDRIAHSWINSALSEAVLETLLNFDCSFANHAWTTLGKLFMDNISATQMQLRTQCQHFQKEDNMSMNDYLQKIHSLYICLKGVGESLQDSDLVAQILIGLPLPFGPFVRVMNDANPRLSFAAIRSLLLSEQDRYQEKGNTYRGKPRFKKAKLQVAKSSFGTPRYVAGHHSSNGSGILGAFPSSNQQLCHICGKGYHSAINYNKRFNHAYTSSKIQHSLAAMQIHDNDRNGSVWYPDSGASAHMTGDSKLLTSLIPYYRSTHVMAGDGSLPLLKITHTGQSSIQCSNSILALKNVLYVPSSSFYVKDWKTMSTLHQSSNQRSFYPFSTSAIAAFVSQSVQFQLLYDIKD
ncbi:hypothetical protein LIER_34477 [Lithospermum erythrorhizon]|uniref:Retrovirus-related Pol polyprotein from transposon TNT 1-94-like beta-barrel domain-containing protein n=1 Tax=Lithospermum erythrorhizon TaxID=34254 RepID=A0AAV3S303_LITER